MSPSSSPEERSPLLDLLLSLESLLLSLSLGESSGS
jgi:hypothetical protein